MNAFVGDLQQRVEMKLLRGAAVAGRTHEAEGKVGGSVVQTETMVLIEGEHGRLHGAHDALDEGEGFERGGALRLQRAGERVDLEGEIAKRVATTSAAGAEGEVVLAQGRDHVG